jgi:kynurenine formamidase
MQYIDLTHALSPDIPSWDGDCCFHLHAAVDYKDCKAPNIFRVQEIRAKAGAGTHIDAPAHCFPGATTIDGLQLPDLLTDCVVISIDDVADERYLVMPDIIAAFEKEHGNIPPNAFVIFYTGWDKYWHTPEKYRNDLRFPSVHEDTAKVLLQRNISGIGIDTLSPDARGEDFPVHRLILGAGKYIVENVANAKNVPPTGAKVMVLPMKIKDGTEAPVRLVVVS